MTLVYTNEAITSPEGTACAILDTGKMDYSSAAMGRKSAKTIVQRALGGELIETKNAQGQTESTYIAEKGDAIFVNFHNPTDVYVPGDSSGKRWAFTELAQRGYEVVAENNTNEVVVKNGKAFKILPEIIDQPTCIKDAWGPGAHQFLYEGATLKLDDSGKTTGIDRDAFNKTWEIVSSAAENSSATPTQNTQRKPTASPKL